MPRELAAAVCGVPGRRRRGWPARFETPMLVQDKSRDLALPARLAVGHSHPVMQVLVLVTQTDAGSARRVDVATESLRGPALIALRQLERR